MRSFLLPLLLIGLAGCGGSGMAVSIPTWQKSVEAYVNETGHGDPLVLRDVVYKGRPGYAQIGDAIPADGTDAVGLLLGQRVLAGQPSLVYLLGMIEKETLADVRIAILQPIPSAGGPTQFKWLVSDANPAAVASYLGHRKQLFEQRFPGRKDIPPAYSSFPAPEDQFELVTAPALVSIVHGPTGITWNLALGGKGQR